MISENFEVGKKGTLGMLPYFAAAQVISHLLAGDLCDPENHPVKLSGTDVELSHVSFGYRDGQDILHDVSLSIPAGRMTALVGPSGSGKSTIAKLIAGFWDVKEGMGCVDEREIPLEQLYDQVVLGDTLGANPPAALC